MNNPTHSFLSLPIESQIRILINSHNSALLKNRALMIENHLLKVENEKLMKRFSEGTRHEVGQLKDIIDIQNRKIERQDKRIEGLVEKLNY